MLKETNRDKEPELHLRNRYQRFPLKCGISVEGIKGRDSFKFHVLSHCLPLLEQADVHASFEKNHCQSFKNCLK